MPIQSFIVDEAFRSLPSIFDVVVLGDGTHGLHINQWTALGGFKEYYLVDDLKVLSGSLLPPFMSAGWHQHSSRLLLTFCL